MEHKKRLFGILISVLAIVAILHLTMQFTIFGTGISGFYENGISGMSIGKFSPGDEPRNISSASPISKFVLIIEWAFLIGAMIYIFARNKREARKEAEEVKLPQKRKLEKSEKSTELDTLYDLLKEKKHLKISTISKLFNISKKVALDWAKTLESGNLATITYPRFGEPELVLNE